MFEILENLSIPGVSLYFSNEYISVNYFVSNHISFTIKLFPIRLFSCTYYLVLKGNCWLENYLGCPVISLPDISLYFSNEYISVNHFVSNHISFTVKSFSTKETYAISPVCIILCCWASACLKMS